MPSDAELMAALRHAVQGEIRYGIREDCRAEIETRWAKVIEALKPKAKKK